MAPPRTPELNDDDVRDAVVYFAALARRWLVDRDPAAARLLAPIVAAARKDARDGDEAFVAELHDDLTELYRDFQKGMPDTVEGRASHLRNLFEVHGLGLSSGDVADLDATPKEIGEALGPADAARKNLALVLGIGDRTIQNYRSRLGMVRPKGADDFEAALAAEQRISPFFRLRWRQTLRAARAVHFLLDHYLAGTRTGATASEARALLKAWRRREERRW